MDLQDISRLTAMNMEEDPNAFRLGRDEEGFDQAPLSSAHSYQRRVPVALRTFARWVPVPFPLLKVWGWVPS